MVSSAYLRLLIFLPAVLILACASSSPAFLMKYSAYKLNKQGDNIQPRRTTFPIWNQYIVPCPVLTVASWPVYKVLVPLTSWQIEGEKVEVGTDYLFLGSKITSDGDCSHEMRRWLLPGRKAMTNLDHVLKSKDITLLTKVHIVKAMVFPVVRYACNCWL